VPYLVPGMARPGVLSRLAGFTITGAMIGLFVALVQQLLKEAWIRVVVGRNEGREYLVEKTQTSIGRSELSDVPLFGDTAVERTHAVIAARGDGRFVLRDNNTKAGTLLNDERVSGGDDVLLRDGDRIGIAGRTLVFRERLTKRRTAPASKDVAVPVRPATGLPSLGDSLPPLPAAAAAGSQRNGTGSAPPAAAPPPTGGARLVVVAGPHAGTTFSVGPSGANIGRDPTPPLPCPAIPRHRACTRASCAKEPTS
jgi:pSer/pThr/pTyr-binding forkhead associated (FHA) protein